MKTYTTKRVVAFISAAIAICCFITQHASAQRCNANHICPTGYSCVNGHCKQRTFFCNCGVHGYGCNSNHSCISFCSIHCGFAKVIPTNNIRNHLFTDSIYPLPAASLTYVEVQPTSIFFSVDKEQPFKEFVCKNQPAIFQIAWQEIRL